MHVDYITVGKRIRLFRSHKKITQEELAFQIGTSAAYISNIESGKKKPSLQKLVQISEVLGVTVNDFIYPSYDISDLQQGIVLHTADHPTDDNQQLLIKNLSALINSFITK